MQTSYSQKYALIVIRKAYGNVAQLGDSTAKLQTRGCIGGWTQSWLEVPLSICDNQITYSSKTRSLGEFTELCNSNAKKTHQRTKNKGNENMDKILKCLLISLLFNFRDAVKTCFQLTDSSKVI